MAERIRAHVYVKGRVQGVYFRQNTMETAKKYRVSGWVRNLPDGRVEGLFEGDREGVDRLIEWCKKGPPRAEVHSVDAIYENYTGEFSDFAISY